MLNWTLLSAHLQEHVELVGALGQGVERMPRTRHAAVEALRLTPAHPRQLLVQQPGHRLVILQGVTAETFQNCTSSCQPSWFVHSKNVGGTAQDADIHDRPLLATHLAHGGSNQDAGCRVLLAFERLEQLPHICAKTCGKQIWALSAYYGGDRAGPMTIHAVSLRCDKCYALPACVEHGVRLIQDYPPDVPKCQVALGSVLQHSLRGAHQQVDGPLQSTHLQIPPATCKANKLPALS
jgi:hypothetical protein